jgi:hypothetical protein
MGRKWIYWLVSPATLLLGLSVFAQGDVNPQAAALQDFEKRIGEYVSLQKRLQKGLPSAKPTVEPQTILDGQHELARKIREARSQAQQGAIFTPEISKEFHRLLGLARAGSNDTHIKKSLERAEPVRLTLHVNDAYPANIPLQSTPPTILMNLPRLPAGLEYRIAGHTLVLRDTVANIVVDLIPDAIP